MEEYWIVYDLATGEELYAGSGTPGSAAYQTTPEGTGIIQVPQAMVRQMPRDLAALREALTIGIDNQAEQVRCRFATGLPLQVGTYLMKETVARRWLADDTSSTVMLASEARERGMTIAALAAEVVANADAWAFLADAIEGIRFAAKRRVAEATTIGAIAAAAVMDWSALDAPAA